MLPKVSQYMDTEVFTLNSDDEVLHAVQSLLEQRVTGAPVVDADRKVIGILTEKDCLKLLAEGDEDSNVPRGVVSEYMTTKVTCIPPRMNIYFVAGMFLNDVVRRFPVVDGDGRLVGAITRFDILRAIKTNL
jgi:predicted transcriptional regulator